MRTEPRYPVSQTPPKPANKSRAQYAGRSGTDQSRWRRNHIVPKAIGRMRNPCEKVASELQVFSSEATVFLSMPHAKAIAGTRMAVAHSHCVLYGSRSPVTTRLLLARPWLDVMTFNPSPHTNFHYARKSSCLL